jgi:hypothetical protein
MVQNPETCSCSQKCCKLSTCPPNMERRNCSSCDCPCLPVRVPSFLRRCTPCRFGFYRPSSCSNCCKCIRYRLSTSPPTCSPCPQSRKSSCTTFQDAETCECSTACCSLNRCPRGAYRDISKCTSCDCPCIHPWRILAPTIPTCRTCPRSSSPFCSSVQDPLTCTCSIECCTLSVCAPGYERRNCSSCSCPCQRIRRRRFWQL